MTTVLAALRGWRVFVPVVVANAAIQAATTIPHETPAAATTFVMLAGVSFLALVGAVVLSVAQADASVAGSRFRWPRTRLWFAGIAAVLIVAGSSLVLGPLPIVTGAVALAVLPALTGWAGAGATFRSMSRRPLPAAALALVTLVATSLLAAIALLSGVFLAGMVSAVVTWLVAGSASALLLCAWSTLAKARHGSPTP
jgi:hypothetical protein